MAVTLNASTSTGLVQSADTSGEIELQSNGTTALKVNTNEGIQILNCLGVGNATPSTSGAGITFPSTQSASSDANTLDDYEEGTFTPTAVGGSSAGTTTYGAQIGDYVKIGKQVTARVNLGYSAMTGTGELVISLPFASGSEYIGSVMTNNLNWAGGTSLSVYTVTSSASCRIFMSSDDAGWQVQQCVNESVNIMLTVTYFTA